MFAEGQELGPGHGGDDPPEGGSESWGAELGRERGARKAGVVQGDLDPLSLPT